MFGYESAATARASRTNRSSAWRLEATASGRTLTATSRPSRVSRALYTSPIPPAPSGDRISNGPSRVPASSVIEGSLEGSCHPPRAGIGHSEPARAVRA
jgi:hypothetical protein